MRALNDDKEKEEAKSLANEWMDNNKNKRQGQRSSRITLVTVERFNEEGGVNTKQKN